MTDLANTQANALASPSTSDPLAGLRDIHLPEAIGWWPPAPGWWFLLGLSMLLIAATYWWLRWRKIQKNKPVVFSNADSIQAALLELDAITQDSDTSVRQTVSEISQLLRRCAVQLSHCNADARGASNTNATASVAGLTGKAWLAWLDQRWDRNDFTQGSGQILIDAPYRQNIESDVLHELIRISRAWLEQQR